MLPFWVMLLTLLVPAIILFYFGKKVMNQVYDLKPIICHVCGRNISQTGNLVNASLTVTCGGCGTRQ
ncbi:hypothetical protein M4D55_05010 [Metabacillus idriensis]|uniref:Uncharacterized protein n=1 Tax=Metabacillus idriensis TaxID=324768 RepID=A0A6I2M420_9BACI|nr:hypothetical protein [Metabacillus idriensis]MCM3595143.1 hypothetical protein [Metabacillus idriensis]MRX52830.1 hypothetical protein [Metabacillus idriensis]OHR65458.1 hypothetical protein HMPREF3291_02465 [Bacillus sp. HMSC76G11]